MTGDHLTSDSLWSAFRVSADFFQLRDRISGDSVPQRPIPTLKRIGKRYDVVSDDGPEGFVAVL